MSTVKLEPPRSVRIPLAGIRISTEWPEILSWACLAGAFLLWLFALPQIDPNGIDDLGLITVLPWSIWVALALNAAGFALTLDERASRGPLPALHLVMLVLILHATPAIVYGTLRYSWAWKHIGIVDFIQRHGRLDPEAPFLAAYHNWPGLFVVSALVANFFHLKPIEFASLVRFAPTVFNLLFAFALVPLFRRFTTDPRLVWSSVWIFLAGNWVGQDYFSPQATAYLLYLLILGLCLGPLQPKDGWTWPNWQWLRSRVEFLRSFVSRGLPEPVETTDFRRGAAAVAVLLMIVAITATHQLTPIIAVSAFLGLALLGRLSIGYALFAIVAEILWLFYFADAFIAAELPALIAELGNTATGMLSKMVDTGVVVAGQVWVSRASRLLPVIIALAAAAGGIRRLLAKHWDGPAVVLALAPIPVLAGTSYGGEAIFRIYFFGLPFFAFFAAAAFFPTADNGKSPIVKGIFVILSMVLFVGFILANNGKDRQYTFRPGEVAASLWLYENAPPQSLFIEGTRDYPAQFMNYEYFSYLAIADEDAETQAEIMNDPVSVFGRWLSELAWKGGIRHHHPEPEGIHQRYGRHAAGLAREDRASASQITAVRARPRNAGRADFLAESCTAGHGRVGSLIRPGKQPASNPADLLCETV